ncbi:hypothetical protein ABGB17_04840 [Sphaerisporangium sp. B11E5]|uniref:hypothetical protein n=1 Tax=Sphaerisporangium sp. B11E5 TaxID=3153563 RepID=UPI00325CF5F4
MANSLFGPDLEATKEKPRDTRYQRLRLLITVKAAPNPSETYGETVCVAALNLDLNNPGWIRLYPINYRELDTESRFRKYDIVTLEAQPNAGDPRPESWRPRTDSFVVEKQIQGWDKRMAYIDDYVERSMCDLKQGVQGRPGARSLAAIRPKEVLGLDIEPHPGWTPEERAKIDRYVNQLQLFESGPRTALQAPRFKAWYRYRCHTDSCRTHRQGIYDWELVALQRRFHHYDDQALIQVVQEKFWDMMCAPERDPIFFVGNQQARPQGFIILGVAYPRRSRPKSRS